MSEQPVATEQPSRILRPASLERRLWRAALERWFYESPEGASNLPSVPSDGFDESGEWSTFWFRTIPECADLFEPYLAAAADEAMDRFDLHGKGAVEAATVRALAAITIRIGPRIGRRDELKILRFMSQRCRAYLHDFVRQAVIELLSANAIELEDEGIKTFVTDAFQGLFRTDAGMYSGRVLYVERILERSNDLPIETSATASQGEVVAFAADARSKAELATLVGEVTTRTVQLEDARKALDLSVSNARAAGATWVTIGRAAGISQQAANARWNPEVKQRRATAQRERLTRGKND